MDRLEIGNNSAIVCVTIQTKTLPKYLKVYCTESKSYLFFPRFSHQCASLFQKYITCKAKMNYLSSDYSCLYAWFKNYRNIIGEGGENKYILNYLSPSLRGQFSSYFKTSMCPEYKKFWVFWREEEMHLSPAACLCKGIKSSHH